MTDTIAETVFYTRYLTWYRLKTSFKMIRGIARSSCDSVASCKFIYNRCIKVISSQSISCAGINALALTLTGCGGSDASQFARAEAAELGTDETERRKRSRTRSSEEGSGASTLSHQARLGISEDTCSGTTQFRCTYSQTYLNL